MKYVLKSEYFEAIRYSEDNFETLKNLRAVIDNDGNPVMINGNCSVVFKMKDETDGRLYAIKCFLKDQERREESYKKIAEELELVSSAFIRPVEYLENELHVDTEHSDNKKFPVLKMDWVEGVPLDRYIREHINDKQALEILAYKFGQMASWLMDQKFAHGDLKPDNILVQADGRIVLVGYDGMFVPSMRGEKSRESGSPDFCHPLRNEDSFDATIDDFSLVSIALSLKAIALEPHLLEQYGAAGRLLFSEQDYRDPASSKALQAVQTLISNPDISRLYGLFFIVYANNNLLNITSKNFHMQKPEKKTEKTLSTEAVDEYGVIYSRDGFRLIKCPKDLKEYTIKEGTKVICNEAFDDCGSLQSITIPNSVTSIGESAFGDCESLQSITIPNSVTSIGEGAFYDCKSLRSIIIPNSVKSIGDAVFEDCESLQTVVFPNSVTSIGESSFEDCVSLQSFTIPDTVTSIGDSAFKDCESLLNVLIPNSVTSIGENAFDSCQLLQNVIIPDSVTSIGESAFSGCNSIKSVTIPNSVKSIAESTFYGCDSLQTVTIPNSVTSIGENAFDNCQLLQNVIIPDSVTSIGESAFSGCTSLKTVTIPDSVVIIGKNAFERCESLQTVIIPDSVVSIGEGAFEDCKSLQSINIPDSVISIGEDAFEDCKSLQSINIPKGTKDKFTKLLEQSCNEDCIHCLNEI